MTLVLLTPIGLDAGCWDEVPMPRGDAVRHVFPGFGDRPRAASQPTMATLADEVAELYDGPLDLAGCSLGGMVALNLAVRRPERVRSLLVACTGASADPEVMAQRAADAEALGMEGVLDVTLRRWFTQSALTAEPEPRGVAYGRGRLLALDPACFADGWRAIATHDVVARLGSIGAPTTAVAGLADAAASVERVSVISDGIPGARLVAIEGPHMMPLERPAEFGAALADHLAWAGA